MKKKMFLMVKCYDFDRNIRQMLLIVLRLDQCAGAVPVFDEYKAAFAFCDK